MFIFTINDYVVRTLELTSQDLTVQTVEPIISFKIILTNTVKGSVKENFPRKESAGLTYPGQLDRPTVHKDWVIIPKKSKFYTCNKLSYYSSTVQYKEKEKR